MKVFRNRELQNDKNVGTGVYFLCMNYFIRRIIFKHKENGIERLAEKFQLQIHLV